MQSHAACLWLLGLLVVSQGCGASAGLESVWRISSTQLGRKLTQATGRLRSGATCVNELNGDRMAHSLQSGSVVCRRHPVYASQVPLVLCHFWWTRALARR